VSVKVRQAYAVGLWLDKQLVSVHFGSKAIVNVSVTNGGNGPDNITVLVMSMANLSATPQIKEMSLGRAMSSWFNLTIEPLANRSTDMNILVTAHSKGDPSATVTRTIEVRVET
jgi:hypothetical protein